MRPSTVLMLVLSVYVMLYSGLVLVVGHKNSGLAAHVPIMQEAVARFGLTDLALSTEARYTRHPAVSDPVAVTMDHPGAIDHFPSTLFWAPPREL
jgi:hypothetical protein